MGEWAEGKKYKSMERCDGVILEQVLRQGAGCGLFSIG